MGSRLPEIIYEDNHLIAVNKRAGDLVQGDKTRDVPLPELLKSYIKNKKNKMGQYTGQPDFGTSAIEITASDTIDSTTKLNSSALFIGSGGDVTVILAGIVGASGGFPASSQAVTFKNLSNGCYFYS